MEQQQQSDLALVQAAMPAILRMAQFVDRLAYLEERNTFEAVVGLVYQDVINTWAEEIRTGDPKWKKPESDPNIHCKADALWRLTELLEQAYPAETTKVNGRHREPVLAAT